MQDLKVTLRIDAETGKVKIEVKELGKTLDDVGKTGKDAGNKVSQGMDKAKNSTNAAKEVAKGMRDELVRLASVGFAVKLVKDAIGLADEMKLLDARIKLVTDSQAEFNLAQEETTRIALGTHTAIGTTVDLYTRLERALQGQSASQTDVLQITESINQAMAVSGATAAETSSVITQLSQGLAAGALRGEEFNSVNESGSRIMQALKDELGKTSGELRQMAFAGELTTEVLTNALLNQSDKISKEFGQLPLTVEKAFTDMRTNFALYAKDINDSADITGKLASGIKFLGDNLDIIIGTSAKLLTYVVLLKGLKGIGGLALSFGKATAATEIYVAATGAATVKVNALSISTKALKGSMALLGGPAGVAILAAYGIYELVDSLNEATKFSDETVNRINKLNATLSQSINFSSIDQAKGHYRDLRLEVLKLNEEIKAIGQDNFFTLFGEKVLSTADKKAIKLLEDKKKLFLDQIKGAELLDVAITKVSTTSKKYYDLLKGLGLKAVKAINDEGERKTKSEKEQQKWLDKAIGILGQYGTVQERVAIIDQERNAVLDEFEKHNVKIPGLIDAVNKKYDEQIKSVKGLKDETKKLNKEKEHLLQLERDERELIDSGYQNYIDFLDNLEFEESLLKLTNFEREKAILSRELEAKGIRATDEELRRLLKTRGIEEGLTNKDNFKGLIAQGNTLKDIFGKISKSMEEGGIGIARGINIALQGAQFLQDIWNSHSGQDSVGQAINSISDVAVTGALGPVAQAIAQVANTINSLTGGRLFGTSYATESTGIDFSLAGGGSGSTTTTEVRQRSLFRGRQWRETVDALTGDALAAIKKIFDQVELLASQTAQAVGGIATSIVDASFSQQFDAEGNLTSSLSTVNGRQFSDPNLEAFTSRVFAEQIISVLDTVLPQVEQQVTSYITDRETGFSIPELSSFSSGEASVLAEQFRNNADALLEFAQFAVLAVSDIENGSALLATLTDNLALVQDLQAPGESFADTYTRAAQSTAILEDVIGNMNITLDSTREDFVRLATSMSDAAGGVKELAGLWKNYFETFYTPDELSQRSLEQSSQLLGQQATNLGIDPTITAEQFRQDFEARLAAGTLTEEQTVQWLQFGQTLGRVNTLIDEANQAELDRVAALNEAIGQYNDFGNSIRRQIDDINGVNNSLNDIEATYQSNIASLNDLARAAGLAGASDRDLADAHTLYVAQIRQATQALFDQLYGDDLDTRIAELEASQTSGINNVASASNSLFSAWERAIDNLRDYTRSRLVDDFSPLEATDRLAQAQADFYAAVDAANNGDLAAAQSLPGLANVVDQLNRTVNASGSDYNDIFYAIQDALNGVNVPNGISNNIVSGNFGGGVSPELQALYDERDARLAAQTSQNRLELATQLAEHLNALATAINQPLFAIAEEMGLSLNNLVTDLGVDLNELTAASVQSLANISNLLGVNLTDLATNLGEDVSLALGDLADAQSLLNDALEGTIGNLPTEYTDLLTPLLRDVENAADGTAQEQALQALSFATGNLPAEYRNQLAPYFADIDPTTEMADALAEAQTQTAILIDIRDLLAIEPPSGPGDPQTPTFNEPSIPPSKSLDIKQPQLKSDPELLKIVGEMSSEIRSLKIQLKKLNSSNDAIVDNTGVISNNTGEDGGRVDGQVARQPQRTVCGGGF